jgi:glycosyltransferase involved in cell wall biosynthesis
LSISVVVPEYSEQENIDLSSDKTEEKMSSIGNGILSIKLLKPTRRFGQPNVTMAGLNYSSGVRWVVIDVDLQDPLELSKEMWLIMDEGFEVIYATRLNCDAEAVIK